ncbi:hypothetical protein CDAR_612801 [Caerostris darwini]|uniref:Uncharacterized protein n=1 Tax=Caerostris darwini TaxID=1538125 RepID=A0AAV4UAR1_9ARAC|nr:hypothetical protein CDAR_612801 [Caerostris darwini]
MEAAEDEWWRRMERDATIDYSVRESARGASNPELMDTMCAAIQSERLTSPTFPEKKSNLSDEERRARITTVIMKKDTAQNLYDESLKLTTLTLKSSAMLPLLIILNTIMTVLLCPPKSLLLRSIVLKILNI